MSLFSMLQCPGCYKYKPKTSHTYASYKVYANDSVIKLVCKSCKTVQRFRYIQGGIRGTEEDIHDQNDKSE